MFGMNRAKSKPSVIDPVIDDLISTMAGEEATTEDYQRMVSSLRTLLEAKAATEPEPQRINPNTLAIIAGNLAGIILILAFEKKNVITSKSLGLLMKPRT
jgi:hypothetical protein